MLSGASQGRELQMLHHWCGRQAGVASMGTDKWDAPTQQPHHQRVHPQHQQHRGWRQGLVRPPPSQGSRYLWRLIGHHHALPSRHGVIHVLGEVVAFHPDEVAGRGCLACKAELCVRGRGSPGAGAGAEPHSPSLKSRPSSWLGQRFTTSVTCSAFL